MHSALKDERLRGKKIAFLDKSTFQSLSLDQLKQMCNQYAILCTPNFLYECMHGNLNQGLLDIKDEALL